MGHSQLGGGGNTKHVSLLLLSRVNFHVVISHYFFR